MIEGILDTVRAEYSSERVAEMLDEEILNWVDSEWEAEGYDSEYDWYSDYGNGEAEDVIILEIMRWWTIEHNGSEELERDTYCIITGRIKEEYSPII